MKNLLLKAMGKQMLRAVYAELLRFTQDFSQRKGERAQQDRCVGVIPFAAEERMAFGMTRFPTAPPAC